MKSATIGMALALWCSSFALAAESGAPAQFDAVIAKHSAATGVPETLIRRIIVRESKYNPNAVNRGHYGMMQIKPATARAMGYRGAPSGLFDADVNLTYGVRYLAGAYKVAGGDHDRAVRFYSSGYYYDAKRKGMLAAIGMGRDGALSAPPAAPVAVATAPAPVATQVATLPQRALGSLFQPRPAQFQPARPQAVQPQPVQTAALDAGPTATPVPMPPIRGSVGPAAPQQVAANAPAATIAPTTTAFVPLPQPRGTATGPRTVPAAGAPVALAAAAPVPQARDAGPATTGSIAPRAASAPTPPIAPQPAVVASAAPFPTPRDVAAPAKPVAPAKPGAPKARVISAEAQPVLASSGPVAIAAPARPAPPALAYAGQPRAETGDAAAQLRAAAPLPPRR